MADGERLLKADAHPDPESGRRALIRDALEEFRAIRRLSRVALTTASMMTAAALPFTSSASTSAKARALCVNSSGDTETNTTTSAAAPLAGGGMVHVTAPATIMNGLM